MQYIDLLNETRPCPFCNPTSEVTIKENETAYLTYAIAPYHADHLLICPKRHTEHFLELSEKEMVDISDLQRAGLAALEKLGYSDNTILFRNGSKSGKSIRHSHYHIIPTVKIDAIDSIGGKRKVLTQQEQDSTVAKIKSVIE